MSANTLKAIYAGNVYRIVNTHRDSMFADCSQAVTGRLIFIAKPIKLEEEADKEKVFYLSANVLTDIHTLYECFKLSGFTRNSPFIIYSIGLKPVSAGERNAFIRRLYREGVLHD